MFYDLIYTRCRHGVDILRAGQPILSDGFKVYACSSAIYKDDIADLQLIMNSVQKKQSFSEPDFMDDAYLYTVPDKGLKVLNVFHPVPYDLSVTGDFAKRPGMYLNHSVLGKYTDIYPYETFHDKNIWTAQENNEAYYYEQEPTDIFPRDISIGEVYYDFEKIGLFIKDGRQEALKKIVAFLIEQNSLPVGEQRYLVIKDESSENIELWIAAVELAFSPRIAAGISFATRMDKYAASNVYYVNEEGVFSQKQQSSDGNYARLRASIVGVVAKDKANTVRVAGSSQFVVLDGEKKEALFDCGVSGRYFQIISSFDDMHRRFSREFLQSFDIVSPTEEIKELAESYDALCGSSFGTPSEYAKALSTMSKFNFIATPILKEIYDKINERLNQFIENSLGKTLPILNWVDKSADIMEDIDAKTKISSIITNNAESVFFTEYKKGGFTDFWENVKNGPFVADLAKLFNDEQKMDEHTAVIRKYDEADAAKFVEVYCSACREHIEKGDEDAKMVIAHCVAACSKQRSSKYLAGIVDILGNILKTESYTFMIESVKTYEPESVDIITNYIVKNDKVGKGNLNDTMAICKALSSCDMDSYSMEIMRGYIEHSKNPIDLNLLASKAGVEACFNDFTRKRIFEMLDEEVDVTNSDSDILASSIQNNRPNGVICTNSAHLMAVSVVENDGKRESLKENLKPYIQQEFPSVNKRIYVSRFATAVLTASVSAGDYEYLLELIASANDTYGRLYLTSLVNNAERYKDKWNATVVFIANYPDAGTRGKLTRALSSALLESGMKKKGMEALGKSLTDKSVRKYFDSIVSDASDAIKEREGSVVSRLFGGFKK